MSPLAQAKQLLPLPDLMIRLGYGDHAKKSAKCPFHPDRNNSFSVFQAENGQWVWNCFAGCGGGDAAAFLARIEMADNSQGCRRLIELAGSRAVQNSFARGQSPNRVELSSPKPIPAPPDPVVDAWREGLDYLESHPIEAVQLAESRSWPVSFAQYLVSCAAISKPLYFGERGFAFLVVVPEVGRYGSMVTRPVGYHVRIKADPDSRKQWTWRFQPSEKQYGHGIPSLPFVLGDFANARLLIVSEGQWDILTFCLAAGWLGEGRLWPEKVSVIGIRGVGGNNTFLRYYRQHWPKCPNCLLLPDSDGPGEAWSKGADCFAEQLARLCSKVAVVGCAPSKDFNALYAARRPGSREIQQLLASLGMEVESEVLQ